MSRPVAIAEILLLLALAAFVGWLLGRLVLNGRINALRAAVADKETELADCRRSKATGSAATVSSVRDAPMAPIASQTEPVINTPVAYVPADPLLPAFSHDDTSSSTPTIADEAPINPSVVEVTTILTSDAVNSPGVDSPTHVSALHTEEPVMGNSEAAVLSRIAARANEINFDRIGRATATDADDLKDIVGIGPFLERKLYSLGIYTYRQIANFTKEDVDKINSIIEFFPGRIERDNWVEQANLLHEKKHGKPN